MFVYNYNVSQGKQELRDEHDKRPGFSEYNMSRPDLLDNYAEEHPEILKTPISHLFNEKGRNKYENSAQKKYDKITQLTSIIPDRGVSDASYQKFFKQGQSRQYGRIHNELSRINLTPPQLDHLIKNGNESSKHLLASRTDLSPEQMRTLANTSNIAVHQNLLTNPKLTSDAFDIIANKAHAEVHDKVISHPFFTNTHLINKIKKGDNSFLQKYLYTHGTSSNENNTNDIINNISDSTMFNTLLTHHYYNNNNFLNNHQLVNIINKSNSPDILSKAVYQDKSKELRNEIVKSGNINTLLNYHQNYGLLPEHKQIVYDKLKEHINNNPDFLKNANIGYTLGGELLNDKTINIAPHNRYLLKHRLYISGKNDISMSKEDIENHIHPYINDEIKNSKDDEERADILISHPHITDTHVKNLLSKGISSQSLKSRYSSSLPFHLVNTVAKHAIKHNDDELLSSILNLHKFDRDTDGNTHFDNLADDIIKTNNPKMIKFLAQNAAYKSNLTNKLINHAKSANNQEINNAVAMIPDFNVSKNFIENAIHTKNEEVMNNHILNFTNHFRNYPVTDGKLNDEDYTDLSNVAKILDHEKSKGEYNNLRVLASKSHNSSYNNGKTFFIRRMINSNDAETYHNLIDSTPHLLKPEHIEHMRKLNNASVNEKLDKLPHQPINESYQDLLYKFITEVKKNKVESNSLPILNDSTNDDSNVINHQK